MTCGKLSKSFVKKNFQIEKKLVSGQFFDSFLIKIYQNANSFRNFRWTYRTLNEFFVSKFEMIGSAASFSFYSKLVSKTASSWISPRKTAIVLSSFERAIVKIFSFGNYLMSCIPTFSLRFNRRILSLPLPAYDVIENCRIICPINFHCEKKDADAVLNDRTPAPPFRYIKLTPLSAVIPLPLPYRHW